MDISGIGSTSASTAVAGAPVQSRQIAATGGGLAFPGQQAALPGAAMAQPGGGKSILKKMVIGAVAGAGVGAGYGLLSGMLSFMPPLMVVGVPIGAAIGAAAGALLGLVKGVRDHRKGTLAMKQMTAQVQQGAGVSPTAIANVPRGNVYQIGATGRDVQWTQRALRRMGLYSGKISGRLDDATAKALRKYELMKGALPTGASTPEVRQALAADIRAARQFG